MTNRFICRMKSYIQPFERKLALAELAAIAGTEPRPVTQANINPWLDYLEEQTTTNLWNLLLPAPAVEHLDFEVLSNAPLKALVDKLAYWEYIEGMDKHVTTQILREATVNIMRNGIALDLISKLVPFNGTVPIPNRRCLRYGTHGIHEYRGKFFPQLVRALINIAKVPDNGVVADPMCGSGTTVVEAILSGRHGLGLDFNPLSVLMSQTKCSLLSVDPENLLETYHHVCSHLLQESERPHSTLFYFSTLSKADQIYLKGWFSERILEKLDRIATLINSLEEGAIRDLMTLSLSNMIRSVSWQKEEDLRVRKEIKDDANINPITEFLEEARSSVKTVLAFLYQIIGTKLGTFEIREADARKASSIWNEWHNRVDVVITSPPYATALPYLDTDRLSLYYLGLLSRHGHRRRDLDMIGNREISEKVRQVYWSLFQEHKQDLPNNAIQLIERIHELNSVEMVGFRRRNVSALLVKYFLDMREVLVGIAQILKPGAYAFVVIGNNHTVAGGERVDIETSSILSEMAAMIGLEQGEHISMDMLVSREIYRSNAVAAEVILSLRKPTL